MLHYWGDFVVPPCGPDKLTRHIVREEPIPVAAATLAPILAVLERAAENAAFMSYSAPTNVWKLPLCSALAAQCQPLPAWKTGYTTATAALNLALKAATDERAAARTNLETAKAALNASLAQLKGTNTSTKVDAAESAATLLQQAESRMEGARTAESEAAADLQALPNITYKGTAEWDAGRPGHPLAWLMQAPQ